MMVVLEAREDAGERAQGHKIMVCATTSLIDRSNENDKVAIDDTKDSQTTSGLGRKGPEPRSVLGAPLVLANKDMQRGAAIP